MVDDLFVGWQAVYFFESTMVGSRIGYRARSYRQAEGFFIDEHGFKPTKLVGLEIC